MGCGGRRIHALERPADRDRRAGRQLGRDPEHHHVPAMTDRSGMSCSAASERRRRRAARAPARARPQGTRDSVARSPRWALAAGGGHRSGVRHGRRAGAARGQGDIVLSSREGIRSSTRSTPWRGACRDHMNSCGRGQRLLQIVKEMDGSTRALSHRPRAGSSAPRHREPHAARRSISPIHGMPLLGGLEGQPTS